MTDSAGPAGRLGRRRVLLAAALAGSLALAACAADETDTTGSVPAAGSVAPTTTTSDTTAPATTAPAAGGVETTPPVDATSDAGTDTGAGYDFSAVTPIVDAAIAEHGLNGAALVVVQRDDGVVHEQYWGEFGPDRISLIASSSKMMVAGVLLRLADQGLLDLDAPVADVVEWGSGNPTVTPVQLVSNSSGLVGLGPNPGYPPYLCQFLPGGTLADCAASIFTTTADDDAVIPPDTEFRYGGAQWQVAGALAEAVSGRSWAELIEETYVEPCGVDSLGFNNHWTQFALGFDYPAAFGGDPSTLDATDNPNLEGGAYVTAPDYAELLLMLLRDGNCGDTPVLSPAAVERMLADRIGEVYGGSDNGAGYGLGWFVDRTTGRRTDPGAYGSVPWLDVAGGHGAYLVIEGAGRVGNQLAAELFDPVAAAVAAAP
ncbi:MAG TPA: serine hydrolase domain-containing protein [Ilumatobacteraceae bacterium]|nr:serine hydrolase domain-containing protein [Ilumatobacteraceae bacterium]